MEEHLPILRDWIKSGKKFCLARVIKTWGSSPRPVGSVMLINEDGSILGSVSGGCVEASVVKSTLELIKTNSSKRITFGVSNEEAWSVGLSCGGSIEVFIETVNFHEPLWINLMDNISNNKNGILISSLENGENEISYINDEESVLGKNIDEELKEEAFRIFNKRISQSLEFNGKEYFIQIFQQKPILIIVGVAHISVELVALANKFGFETILIDPRGFFSKNTIFIDEPSKIYEAYPSEVLKEIRLDAYTFAAILSHDPKIDDNALEVLLKYDLGYIGALGSRKTHAKRISRLRELGIDQSLIDKIKAPIGLPINALKADEIALAIMGEIIQAKNQYAKG